MARKDLTEFLQERLTALDPLRDVSSGSSADTEVIQPIRRYFGADLFRTDVRSFVLDTIRGAHPELGVQPDGVEDDAVGKPVATLAHGLAREIILLRERQRPDPRIHTIDSASDLLGALFVPRREGGRAFGKFRFYYAAPLAEIIRPENVIIAGNGMRFAPVSAQTISLAEMQLNYEDGKYYFDVDTMATTSGSAGNITPGTSCRCPSVVRSVGIASKQLFRGGADADTVAEFLDRARNYPTQLSLSVARGIKAIVANEFGSDVRRIEVVGMGDPDMLRDVIKGGNFGSVDFPQSDGTILRFLGVEAQALPSFTSVLRSNLVSMKKDLTLFGSGELADDYYLILHTASKPGTLTEGRIFRVVQVGATSILELDDAIVPLIGLPQMIWEIRRRRITISDVPGGLLLPPAAGSEVEIKDGEVHVGGCTDVYLLGQPEERSTDIEVASDEDDLASGTSAVAGGKASWPNPGGWIRLDTTDRVLLEITNITKVILDGGAQRGVVFSGVTRGKVDLADFRFSPGFLDAKYGVAHSDILEILISGNWVRYPLMKLTAEGGAGSNLVFWTNRDILPSPLPVPTAGRIVRPVPDGIDAGRTMLVIRRDPEELYRVVEWRHGFFQGTDTDPDNYRAEVRVYPLPDVGSTYPTGEEWVLVDDVDVDLSDPKRLKANGSDLETTTGSSVVTTTSARNMEEVGAKKDDILRIEAGPDTGDHILAADPSGPGKVVLQLSDRLTGAGTWPYRIFSPQTPIERPLIDVREATLLDSKSGTTSSIIPLGTPLGAISSQFANAGTGLKWRRTDCIAGIMGLAPFTSAPWAYDPGPADYLELTVYSEQWGLIYKKLASGGPWDFTIAGQVAAFLEAANSGLPVDYFFAVRPDGSIAEPSSIVVGEPLYLAVAPYDSDESTGTPGATLVAVGAQSAKFMNPGATGAVLTSRSVTFFNLSSTMLAARLGISPWNDVVQIENGLNEGKSAPVLQMSFTSDNMHLFLFPGVRLLPQLQAHARIGSPSVGLGRTFFRDPTLYEVDQYTRYRFGDAEYCPDQRLFSVKTPGYPETTKPAGLYVGPGPTTPIIEFYLPDYWAVHNIELLDYIEPGCRDMWFLHDFAIGPWAPAPGTYQINFTFDELPARTIEIDAAAGPFTRDQLKTLINDAFDPVVVAIDVDIGAAEYVGISMQDRITALYGSAVTDLGGMEPTTYATLGNWSYLAQKNARFGVVLFVDETPGVVYVQGTITPPYEDGPAAKVQFRVIRFGQQRFPSKRISENIHGSGLYYADVELMSLGAGNEWNVGPDQSFDAENYRCLGYRIRPENAVLSFSTREVPIFSATPYIQDPAVGDGYEFQTGVYGSGLRLAYDRSPEVAGFQALADSEDERENNESVLGRTMLPCEVFLTVEYTGGLAEDEMRKEIETLVKSQMENLDVSRIVYRLQQLGATSIKLPVEIGAAYVRQNRDYRLTAAKDRVDVSRLAAFLIGRLTLRRIG